MRAIFPARNRRNAGGAAERHGSSSLRENAEI
jgi:hypothetical protein